MDKQRLRVLEDFVEEECIPAEHVFDAQVRLIAAPMSSSLYRICDLVL
jgi:hypothetical protein